MTKHLVKCFLNESVPNMKRFEPIDVMKKSITETINMLNEALLETTAEAYAEIDGYELRIYWMNMWFVNVTV